MKRILLKVFFCIMCLSLVIYILIANSPKNKNTIDLIGGNDYFHASLNIHLQYDSELIIYPTRDDFQIPSEINIDIVVKNKCVYTDKLRYIPNEKFAIGKYTTVRLKSNDYFKKDFDDIKLIIRFSGQSNSILLRTHS